MINLLSEKKVKFDKKKGVALKVKMWAGVVLVGYIAIVVLSMLVSQVFVMRMNSTEKALNEARLQLTSKILLIQKYDSVLDRARVIDTVLTKRRESINLWNTVRDLLPPDVELLEFGLEGNILDLGFSAPHVVSANQMISVIETQFDQLNSKEVEMGATRSDDAGYIVSAVVTLQ